MTKVILPARFGGSGDLTIIYRSLKVVGPTYSSAIAKFVPLHNLLTRVDFSASYQLGTLASTPIPQCNIVTV